MNCSYKQIKTISDGVWLYTCTRCGHSRQSSFQADRLHRTCNGPLTLPGDILSQIIIRIVGKQLATGCKDGCGKWIRKMNEWGSCGCREHLEEITERLTEQATKHQWKLRVPGIGSFARLAPEGVQRWSCRQLALLAIRKSEKHGK